MLKCSHNGKPAWAQNDAMVEAYIDGMDYGYRINDDTLLLTPGWTEKFIASLMSLDIPNIGVVGPNHKGGNAEILTYDFTHKTHIEVPYSMPLITLRELLTRIRKFMFLYIGVRIPLSQTIYRLACR